MYRAEKTLFSLVLQPDRQDELLRIEREGGKVINWNGARVFGVLAMSRAIGFLLTLFLHFFQISCFAIVEALASIVLLIKGF